jgi:TldD protein
MNRRTFIKGIAATGVLAACGGKPLHTKAIRAGSGVSFSDPDLSPLADVALEAATSAGATYADIRISRHRTQYVSTREERVETISERESYGFGVRVIADGTWGFAASSNVTRDEIATVARQAVAIAKAQAPLRKEPVQLAPVDVHRAVWKSPIRKDPFEVPIAEKVETLLTINAEAMTVDAVSFCSSAMDFTMEHKFFASTEGSYIEQMIYRCNPWFSVTSVSPDGGFHSRNSLTAPQGLGYEYVEDYPWAEEARRAGRDAKAMHSASSVEPGKRDLILLPSHLWLTIHESIGHPTELDRALGYEANYAGTSFLTPDKLGKLQLGSDKVSLVAEKTAPGSLATVGYDDDGAKTTEWYLVRDGLFVDYQTTRDQAHWIGRERGYASSYAMDWGNVAFQRMPNVNLLPGTDALSLEQLIAATEDAILIAGTGSYSIDHQRYNFQFGGQVFQHVKNGKIVAPLKDVAYQANTREFWNSCDAICDESEYWVGGSYYDGKGEPGQVNAVSHGCSPTRFRQVNVINTARKV